jgi:hypothetical protein
MRVEPKTTTFCCRISRFLFLLVFIFLFDLNGNAHAHGGTPWVSVGPFIEALPQAEPPNVIKCSRKPEHGDPHFSRDAFDLWFPETVRLDVRRFNTTSGRKLLKISENLLFSDGSDSGLRTFTLFTSRKLTVTVKAKREVAMAHYSCDTSSTEIMEIVSDLELSAPTTAASFNKKTTQPAGEIETICLRLGFTEGTAKFEKCVSRLAREPIASDAVAPSTQQKPPADLNKEVSIPDVKKSTPTVNPMCLSIEKKVDNHIQKSEYDLAQKAISLMDRLNCKVKGNETQ